MADHGTKNQRGLNLDAIGDHASVTVAEARADKRLGKRIDSEIGGQVDILENADPQPHISPNNRPAAQRDEAQRHNQ